MKRIGVELEATILRHRLVDKWPLGTIAREVGVHHGVVRRVLAGHGLGTSVDVCRPRMIDPYVPFIEDTFGKYPGLHASRLHQMVKQRGYAGSESHFRRLVAQLRPAKVHEAFLRLHKHMDDKGRAGIRSLKTWLFVVARNLALDVIRKRGREKELWGGVFQDGMGDKQRVPRGDGELGKIMQKESCEQAVEELHKLPDEEKEVLVLRIMEGMTLREISLVTGLKVGNVDYRISKGLRQLADRLKTAGVI